MPHLRHFRSFACFAASSLEFGWLPQCCVILIVVAVDTVAMSFTMVHALGLELPVRSLYRARVPGVDTGNRPPIGFGYGGVNHGYGVTRDILDLEGVDSDYEALTVRSESDSIDSEVSTISGVSTDGVSEAGSVSSDEAGSSVEDPEAEGSLSNEVGVDRQEVQKKHPKPLTLVFTKDSLGSSETRDTN